MRSIASHKIQHSLGTGPPILSSRRDNVVISPISWYGKDPIRMSHWTFLSSDPLQLSLSSCMVVTIKDFVFCFFLTTVFCLVNSVKFFVLFFGQNGRIFISEKESSSNRKFEKKNPIPTLLFVTISSLTSLASTGCLRRRV